MPSGQARNVRQAGHSKAQDFALRIGMPSDYQNNLQAKKDVIDRAGDAHSVKSGKYWQMFLYRQSRLREDVGFQAMREIRAAMLACLHIFPDSRQESTQNKDRYKQELAPKMITLKECIQHSVKPFLSKAIFIGN